MQIMGGEFVKKVQLKQEKEELEKKLNELNETRIPMSNINLTNNLNNAYNSTGENELNELDRLQKNLEQNENNSELDSIMLNQTGSNEDNKRKYLILGIALVVLFLLTIIIIRLLTNDSKKEDPFTTPMNSDMKSLSENSDKIEDRYKKILEEREKSEPKQVEQSSMEKLEAIKEIKEAHTTPITHTPSTEITHKENGNTISNETIDETIKKIEEKQQSTAHKTDKDATTASKTSTEPKRSIKDLVEGNKSNTVGKKLATETSGFFVQIGAFSKEPNQSYLNNIAKEGLSYKVIKESVKGTMYNKVLIGPYKTREEATKETASIKQKLKLQSAFIVSY